MMDHIVTCLVGSRSFKFRVPLTRISLESDKHESVKCFIICVLTFCLITP